MHIMNYRPFVLQRSSRVKGKRVEKKPDTMIFILDLRSFRNGSVLLEMEKIKKQ